MKSLTGKFSSARGWALLLILFLGAGLMVAACGDDEPATTPAPAPEPEPEPEPEPDPPAVPTGLRISATGQDFIEWIWTPVGDVSGYDVQYSVNEVFTDEDEIVARTAEQVTYRREGLEPEASGSVRVRSAAGTGDDRITSDWSTHVTGMAMAVPVAPPTPTGLMVSATETSITWTWTAAPGAEGYVVQISEDEVFETMFEGADQYAVTRETSHTIAGLEAETTRYARVAAGVLTGAVPSLDPGDYLLSAWTIHATGMTEAAAPERPPAPANVRLRTRGSDFLEWTWDAVEGASGYQSQFSASSTFPSGQAGSEIHQGMASTTRRVANLDAESDGHLRVRTYTGTLTEPTYGDWSDGHRATTAEPPPAAALDAPEGLRGSAETGTSITLTWDAVDDADTYEVRQREPGGAWSDASCGSATADNEVADEECVASGLDSGTDYDFGVRALPANNDRAHNTSAWSDTLESRTTGTSTTTPPPTTSGGMGSLNVTWKSDVTDGITWNWEPVSGATYEWIIKSGEDLDFDAADPCGEFEAATETTGTEFSETEGTESPALLCVRTKDEKDKKKDLSWAFATRFTTTENGALTLGDITPAVTSGKRTTALTWSGIGVKAGFTYEINVAHRSGGVQPLPTAGSRDLQNACSAGRFHEGDNTDVDLDGLTTTVISGLQPYTGYFLCLRMKNEAGATDWIASPKHYTAPGTAPRAIKNAARSDDDRTAANEIIVWDVRTRGNAQIPREPSGYTVKLIRHPIRNDGDDDDSLHDDAIRRPTAATCGEDDFDSSPYVNTPAPTASLTSQGFTLSATIPRPATEVQIGTNTDSSARNEILPAIVSICIQATYGDPARSGPWSISSAETIERQQE